MNQIEKKAKEYLNKAGEGLKSKGVIIKTKVGIGDAAEAIAKAADETKANLVAMSTHGRSGVGRWVFGSVAEKVLRGGDTPVILVRAPVDGTK